MIRAPTRRRCFQEFHQRINGYWGRLTQAGSGRGVVALPPRVTVNETESIVEATLGDALVRAHTPMATFEDVELLQSAGEKEGVLLGSPPSAVVLGIQRLLIEPEGEGFALRTAWYKYCLLLQADKAQHLGAPGWFALRLESDPRIGWNSWLLNHPIHHYQLGLRDDLRILSRDGRSLVSFVDAALRLFAPEAWGEMYPALYLELTEPTSAFAALTQRPAGPDIELRPAHAEAARHTLREARAKGFDWYDDREQWRADVAPWSETTAEMFDVIEGSSAA